MLYDHLKGGKYDNTSQSFRRETLSVNNTNSVAEIDFRILEWIRENPNSNMIIYEAIIVSRSNKVSASQKSQKVFINDKMGKGINSKNSVASLSQSEWKSGKWRMKIVWEI